MLGEAVEARHLAAGIDVAAEPVERAEQVLAVAKPIERDPLEDHVVGLAGFVAAADELERGMGNAEEAAVAVVAPRGVVGLVAQAKVRRHRVDSPVPCSLLTQAPAAGQPPAGAGLSGRPVMH